MTLPVSEGFRELPIHDGPLRFELRRSSRKTIGIKIESGGAVVVTAPHRASLDRIQRTLVKHGRWVRRQVEKLRKVPLPPPPPKWVDGEIHRFLGRKVPLRLIRSDAKDVWLTDFELLVHAPNPDNRKAIMQLVEGWMVNEAKALFSNRMGTLIRTTPTLGVQTVPELSLRRMKARWGSCSPDGRILMNTHAVRLPLRLVDYILMHELCHLKFPNHSREFWSHLESCMPDWEQRKSALDRSQA